MQITTNHRKQITAWFCIIFYVLMIFKWIDGMFLYQLQPILYNIRFDLITWNLMHTGLHQLLLANRSVFIIFDILFYSLPLIYLFAFRAKPGAATIAAGIMLIVNWIYIQCYTLFPTNSIESYNAWLLFPVLFMTTNIKNFYFLLHGLRYFFLFFFASAGIWKLVQYGAFNPEQMSGVLLFQHKEFLTSSPGTSYSNFIYWLISHPTISYLLYLCGAIIEIAFLIGFLTKKHDRWLTAVFLTFLCFNVLIMRIHYWEMTPFLLVLFYSKYSFPDERRYFS